MVILVVQVFLLVPLPLETRAALETTSTTAFATLHTTAQAIDHASDNGEENQRCDDDSDDNRPLAVSLGHALVPTSKRTGVGLEIAHNIPRPQGDGSLIHRTHYPGKTCAIHREILRVPQPTKDGIERVPDTQLARSCNKSTV